MTGERGGRKEPRPGKYMCGHCGTWMFYQRLESHAQEFRHPDILFVSYDDYMRQRIGAKEQ
jgi:hypothetical protein